jgi:hypothetical protein
MKTPVVFLIFNRPDTTQKVFESIRNAKPPQLLVVADGHRQQKPGEAALCSATREVIEGVDWECEVLKNYSDINLGCAKRVASGLDWVFNTVEKAIILEDDCVPHPSFFPFCEELLDRYEDDERIMSITGTNFQFGRKRSEYSYYYSDFHYCWGWATWQRAWQYFDFDMKLWPQLQEGSFLKDKLSHRRAVKYWNDIFQRTSEGKINSWFYRWLFACWSQSGLTVMPEVNLVSNIGFSDVTATNTKTAPENSLYANMSVEEMKFPLLYPPFMTPNIEADRLTQETRINPNLLRRGLWKIRRIWRKYLSSNKL